MYRAKVYGVAGFERQFAVKRFHPELVALPVVSQRLSAAARAYGSLEHPRIARLHEYGVAGGEVFTATEMVAGLDVMRLVAATHGSGQALPPGAALALVTQAARAIGYAHGRGINHLGLCPTNVVVTPDGDVKITDFGILAQTLTVRPSNDSRLVVRIPYLAPEQLIGEATSAATDVFALGALVHELLTGERAFVGLTSLDVEHAILSGHVRDAGLPKALARVLVRCFARSPYERFPDARALADAVDAALRVSPVVGGRRELGGIVKDAVVRLDAMNEGQLSGAMMLAMPMPPSPSQTLRMGGAVPPAGALSSSSTDSVTAIREPYARRVPDIAPRAPANRPPPMIPPRVVQKTMPPPVLAARLAAALEESDERTIQRPSAPPLPPKRGPSATRTSPTVPQLSPTPGPVPASPARTPSASPPPFQTSAAEGGGPVEPRLRLDSAWETSERAAIQVGAEPLALGGLAEPLVHVIDDDSEGVPVVPPIALDAPVPAVAERAPIPTIPVASSSRRRAVRIGFYLTLCAGLGIGIVVVWYQWVRDRGDGGQASASVQDPAPRTAALDARAAAAGPASDAGVELAVAAVPDAQVAISPPGAAVDAGAGRGVEPAGPGEDDPAEPGPSDLLVISSTPSRARVYVDGAEQGDTPATLSGSDDRHALAVVLPGYALYTAEIDGRGTHQVILTEVTPTAGPAGIKVKCREKDRYYVVIDGHPTGQLCPTERIGVELGDHMIEIYDLVTDTWQQHPARLKETRNSFRVKAD